MFHLRNNRFTLTQKLIVSFSINGICMLGALVYAIVGLNTMHRMVGDIAHNDLTAATAAINLRDSMLAQERTARKFMILGQLELVDVHGRQAETFRKAQTLLRERTNLKSLNELDSRYAAYTLLGAKLFTGKPVSEAALIKSAAQVETAIEKLRAEQQQLLELKLTSAKQKEASTLTWALGLALCGVALAFTVAALLVYTFSASIGKLKKLLIGSLPVILNMIPTSRQGMRLVCWLRISCAWRSA